LRLTNVLLFLMLLVQLMILRGVANIDDMQDVYHNSLRSTLLYDLNLKGTP
jgi:hypothetical protein